MGWVKVAWCVGSASTGPANQPGDVKTCIVESPSIILGVFRSVSVVDRVVG